MFRSNARGRKHRIILVVILLGLAMLMSLEAREPSWSPGRVRGPVFRIFSPAQKYAALAIAPVADYIKLFLDRPRLARENRALRSRLSELEWERSLNHEIREENRRLASLWSLEPRIRADGHIARVIGRDFRHPQSMVTLDRGESSGVQQDSPVVTLSGFVVGQVVGTAKDTCQVMLIIDPGSSVAVLLGEGRSQGLVRGRGQPQCVLDFIVGEGRVTAGEELFTAGMDGIYPPGLPVGKILSVSRSREGLVEAVVGVSAALAVLEEVMILQPLAKKGDLVEPGEKNGG